VTSADGVVPDDLVTRLRAAGCVFAEDEAALLVEASAGDGGELERMLARRVAGDPLEHILGWAEFRGLRIAVGPGVFVPRQRTGFLVETALRDLPAKAVVLDLCCGSGAVGAAIAAAAPGCIVYAAEFDPAAVASARRNLPPERVFEGDLYAALPSALTGRVDALVVNAPYVPTEAIATMPPEARLYEARLALDGGHDGLDVQRRVVSGAIEWLAPGGRLLIETSERQAPLTAALFEAAGLHPQIARSEDLDATVVTGSRQV
jgi:release factor glutamine methyltransferase